MLVQRAATSRPATTGRWWPRSAATAPICARSCSSATRSGPSCMDVGRGGNRALLAERETAALRRRPDQHPVHVGHDRVPQGRHAHPPQPAQQRVLRRRGLRLHRGRPGLHPGALLPLLRHGHGQPGVHLATGRRRSSRRPGSTRPRRCRPCRTSAAPRCTASPPCSSPSWPCPTSPTTTCPPCAPGIMAGSPCPVEVMKRVVAEMGMERGDHLLRHDRDLTGVHPDRCGRRPGPPHLDRRPGAPAPRGQGGRPGHRADRAARGDRRVLHPRLLGDARLLERAGEDRRGDRRGPLDAHRRPRGHGRRRAT